MKGDYGDWPRYVPAAERRAGARAAARRLEAEGRSLSPVLLEGSRIAGTLWGRAWCENLERYSDFANRLPRGRSYLRSGSVIDLKIEPGVVTALVSGTAVYEVQVKVAAVPPRRWAALRRESAGAIDSLVALLQGRLSQALVERLCRERTGLFPSPAEIELACSCPDRAAMCKHVAAVLYGIGTRLDRQPELLFVLRRVEATELITAAGESLQAAGRRGPAPGRVLRGENLAELFGLDIAGGDEVGGDEAGASPGGEQPARKGKGKQAGRRRPAG